MSEKRLWPHSTKSNLRGECEKTRILAIAGSSRKFRHTNWERRKGSSFRVRTGNTSGQTVRCWPLWLKLEHFARSMSGRLVHRAKQERGPHSPDRITHPEGPTQSHSNPYPAVQWTAPSLPTRWLRPPSSHRSLSVASRGRRE